MIKYSAIDLQQLQGIFDTRIRPYHFVYTLDDGVVISLMFEESQLCHLLGIQKVDYSRADLQGQLGYDEIKNGKLTFSKLKSINRHAVERECKDKMRFFDEMPDVLANPECAVFDRSTLRRQTKICMSHALNRECGGATHRLMLGVDTNAGNCDYFPRTWLIEKLGRPGIMEGQVVCRVVSTVISSR